MLLRAKNARSYKEGGLLIWTDGHVTYGAWNPLKDTITDDWKKYDLAEIRS